jgi:hypothetical protein
MTIYEMGILMHYHCRVDDHPDRKRQPPVWTPTIESFFKEGLLESRPFGEGPAYQITPRGRAYMDYLQQVPLPLPTWYMPGFDWTFEVKP